MSGYPNMSTAGGRQYREDGSIINEANYSAPQPNGGQVLTVNAAGIVELTIPEDTIMIVLTNPVAVRIAYGVDASESVGTYYPAYSCPILPSHEACEVASIYFTGACAGAYAQYWK